MQGNFDALSGAVSLEPPAEQVSDGVYAGDGTGLAG